MELGEVLYKQVGKPGASGEKLVEAVRHKTGGSGFDYR
jgi:hypothetical protein